MDNAKKSFTQMVQSMATELAHMDHLFEDISAVYNARLYGPGAENAFTDAELLELESVGGKKLTADDIYAFIILCDQMKIFIHNGVPAQRDYAANINHIRTDI